MLLNKLPPGVCGRGGGGGGGGGEGATGFQIKAHLAKQFPVPKITHNTFV